MVFKSKGRSLELNMKEDTLFMNIKYYRELRTICSYISNLLANNYECGTYLSDNYFKSSTYALDVSSVKDSRHVNSFVSVTNGGIISAKESVGGNEGKHCITNYYGKCYCQGCSGFVTEHPQ